jgi:hypothetical protein
MDRDQIRAKEAEREKEILALQAQEEELKKILANPPPKIDQIPAKPEVLPQNPVPPPPPPAPARRTGPCWQSTRYFTKDGEFQDWEGDRSGACGSRKDGRRMYICRTCWCAGVRVG